MANKKNIVDFEVQSGAGEADDAAEAIMSENVNVGVKGDESGDYQNDIESSSVSSDEETEYEDEKSEYEDEDEDYEDGNKEQVEKANTATDAEREEKEKKKHTTLRGVLGNKTLEDVIEREAKEEQDTSSPFSLSKILGGIIISRFIQRQMGVVLVIVCFLIVYISLRYTCQLKRVEISRVEKSIEKARYKATVCSSELTEKSRESSVLKRLAECGDSSLTLSNEPPYLIKIEEK